EETRRAIEELTTEGAFLKRVNAANQKIGIRHFARSGGTRYGKNHPIHSTAQKHIDYYAGDAPNFRVVFNGWNDPTDAAVLLQRLGVRPDQITYATEDAEDAA